MSSLGEGINLTPFRLQFSATEGPIGVKIGTDIEKHVKSTTAFFFCPKTSFLIDIIIYANDMHNLTNSLIYQFQIDFICIVLFCSYVLCRLI